MCYFQIFPWFHAEQKSYRIHPHNRSNCLLMVDSLILAIALGYQSRLVATNLTTRVPFWFRDPATIYWFSPSWQLFQALRLIIDQRIKSFTHCSDPFGWIGWFNCVRIANKIVSNVLFFLALDSFFLHSFICRSGIQRSSYSKNVTTLFDYHISFNLSLPYGEISLIKLSWCELARRSATPAFCSWRTRCHFTIWTYLND